MMLLCLLVSACQAQTNGCDPDPTTAANAYFQQGLASGDPSHFRQATICDPRMAKAYNNLGASLGAANLDQALMAMSHAVRLQPVSDPPACSDL